MEITRARYSYKKQGPRKSKAKRFVLILAASLLLLSSGGYSAAAFSKELPSLSVSTQNVSIWQPESISLPWPAKAQAAIGSSDEGVVTKSADTETAKPIASMTKVITALTILQKSPVAEGEQGPSIVMTANDVALYNAYVAKNGSVVPVRTGQTLTQYQAMEAMLLASANNLADSLAKWAYGSMDTYLVAANSLVKSYGLELTKVSDASGFSPQTVSTPSDMIVIGQKALADPVIKSIVSQKQATIKGIGIVRNTNQFLKYNGAIGLKTGTTDEAGSCLLFAYTHAIDETHSVDIIGVVMGEPNATKLYQDVRLLADTAKKYFKANKIVAKDTIVGTVTSPWGMETQLIAADEITMYGWSGKDVQVKTEVSKIAVPISANQQVGTVSIAGNTELFSDIRTRTSITAPSNIWRLKNVF